MGKRSGLWSVCAVLLLLGAGYFTSCGSDDDDNGGEGSGKTYETLTTERKAVSAPDTAGTIKIGDTTYNSIQEALTAAESASADVTITLGKGTYKENGLTYTGAKTLTIKGLGEADYGLDVVIYGEGETLSTEKGRTSFEITGSGTVILENVTFKSSRQETKGTAQAEVIGTDGTGNLIAYNCSFLSGQDTLRTVTKSWFYKCYIEGDVDFLWMEYTNGIVALYEECVIRAIGSRTNAAYYTAPRLGRDYKVGKGIVIYNSTLEAESGLTKLYLGRNPWEGNASYYEQVAIVGSKLYLADGVSLHSDVWASKAEGTSDEAYIGFKTDDYFQASAKGLGARLTAEQVAAEYAGRNNILNRVYDTNAKRFKKDTDTSWDIASVITANGWEVTEDTSKDLLDGETEAVVKEYDLTGTTLDSTLTVTGFSHHHSSNSQQSGKNASIVVPVTGKAVVYVYGVYSGAGTITEDSQGAGLYDCNTGSTSKTKVSTYVVYNTSATKVTITPTSTTYLTRIVVEYDDTISFIPVESITVSTADNLTEVKANKTLQFSAALTPAEPTNTDIKWEVIEGGTAATIDQNGLLTALKPTADTKVVVKVTSYDANGVSGTKEITALKLDDSAGSLSWAPANAESVSLAADVTEANDTATGGDIAAYYKGTGTVLAASDFTIATSRNHKSITYTPSAQYTFAADDVIMTYKFPVTAQSALTLTNFSYAWGCGATNNIYGQVKIVGSDGTTALYTGEKLQSGTTEGHSNDGLVSSDALDVPLDAGATATIIVELTAKSAIENKTNGFTLADVVLDFKKK